nr:transcriptional regulatory protein sef1 [Quercus suber]
MQYRVQSLMSEVDTLGSTVRSSAHLSVRRCAAPGPYPQADHERFQALKHHQRSAIWGRSDSCCKLLPRYQVTAVFLSTRKSPRKAFWSFQPISLQQYFVCKTSGEGRYMKGWSRGKLTTHVVARLGEAEHVTNSSLRGDNRKKDCPYTLETMAPAKAYAIDILDHVFVQLITRQIPNDCLTRFPGSPNLENCPSSSRNRRRVNDTLFDLGCQHPPDDAMSWPSASAFDHSLPPQVRSPHDQGSPVGKSPSDDVVAGHKRKRSSTVATENNGEQADNRSNGSPVSSSKPRHQPGVKRACNDCRQQKLRCNVVAGPGEQYQPCDRCIKHKLHCSIDNDFKRLGKRAQHEEMARELDMAKAKLAQYEAMGVVLSNTEKSESRYAPSIETSPVAGAPTIQTANSAFLGASEAAASRSLLDLSQGYRELPASAYPSIVPGTTAKTLGGVALTDEELQALYSIYFSSFHPFLPLLSPDTDYHAYFAIHPLLHWTIVTTAARRYDPKPGLLMELQRPLEQMLWTAISSIPQIYHVCKALALICTWPLPSASTSQEPSMMLTGVMFQLAMQYGLHRPSHAQDFSRFRVELREEDIADRLNTWAAVNIVAQSVATGQGQPPLSRWAWYTYGLHLDRMKPELHTRCQIEKFCDTVTRTLFTMQRDHVVEVDQAQRGLQIEMYARELNEMETTIMSTRSSAAFFDKPTQPNYLADLRNVYIAASSLLTVVVELPEQYMLYLPRYIEQIILGGCVTLLKLLNSFYAAHVDGVTGRTLFGRSVNTLRRLSVRSNDLPQRLAEVMAQLWESSGKAQQLLFNGEQVKGPDESLQIKVRCRSSLSVLYDAIWRWRQQVGQAGRENLDAAVENPTAVATNTQARNTPQPLGPGDSTLPSALSNSALDSSALDITWGDDWTGNAVFDPLSWALDGNLQFGGLGGFGTGSDLGLNF